MKASTLHNLQQQFTSAVLGQDTHEIARNIIDNQFSGKQRLNIYSNNVAISLRNALRAVYPVIHKLVGDEFFGAMSRDFIANYPSRSGNLHDFGEQLSSFIGSFAPAGELVYLADVAKLEWAYHSVFHAQNSQIFNIEKLQQVHPSDYGNLIFSLSPASRLVRSPFPILRIWEANQEYNQSELNDPISLDEGETLILVLRRDMDIEFQSLNQTDFSFLSAINNKEKFFTACDAATSIENNCDIGQLLQKHILSGAITGFELASDNNDC